MKIRIGLLALLLGLWVAPAHAESNDIVRIDIPLLQESKYPFIRYRVLASGVAYHVREVGDAHQGCVSKQLTPAEMKKLTEALRTLPSSTLTTNTVPCVSVTTQHDNKTDEMIYRRDQLPSALNTVIQLIGGLCSELKDIIGFRLEPVAGDAAQPPRP